MPNRNVKTQQGHVLHLNLSQYDAMHYNNTLKTKMHKQVAFWVMEFTYLL